MKLKLATVGLFALGAAALYSGAASAMPNGLAPGARVASDTEQVRWVCGPRRCWWQPNYYGAYNYYGGPRVYGRPYYGGGWHRGWHHGYRRW